jgi:hypothetical protein
MREAFDHDYPPAEWTVDDVAGALRATGEQYPLPTYEDEAVWDDLRTHDLTGPVVEDVLERAADAREEPVSHLPATLYLDYTRTGNRTRYQEAWRTRQRRLGLFVLAESFERESEYLDPILDYAWAITEQATWAWPAHLGGERIEGLPGIVPDDERTVALFNAGMAKVLAEIDHVLGERLHPALRERIRAEADRQVFTPYEAREDFGWMRTPANNWNAVCNAGVAVAAMHLLDDVDRQARILTKAVHSLEAYLADFDEDGCTAEGIGYWNYGFSNYVELADHLETRTGGACSLFEVPIVRDIATYPLQVEMSPGHYVPFSDAHEESTVSPYAACRLGERLDVPGVAARGRAAFAETDPIHNRLGNTLRNALAARAVSPDLAVPTPAPVGHFEGFGWWIARDDPADPDGLVVAAKAGHNQESHNHNDCGTFVVHYGRESLLTDLGSPTYDRDYFGPDRYTDYLAPRSLGHSVPHVNGCEQASGRYADDDGWYGSEVIERTGDGDETFGVELAGAYPDAAGLDSLRRTITLERSGAGTGPRVTVADDLTFERPENTFESVLVSYFPLEARDGDVIATGERGRATVTADRGADVAVEHLPAAVDDRDVWRARFACEASGEEGSLELTVGVERTE